MTRRTGLTNDAVATRLAAIEIPPALAKAMVDLGVGVSILERLHTTGIDWPFVQSLLLGPSLQEADDVYALVTLLSNGMEPDEVMAWSRLGRLDHALRLYSTNVPLNMVKAFPLPEADGLYGLMRMRQKIKEVGIHTEDMLLWHTAGVLRLTAPFLDAEKWSRWRSVGVNHLGLRVAALAAAAGLTIEETLIQHAAGELDRRTLQMMASLRLGQPLD